MSAYSPLAQVIDNAERSGRLNLRTADIANSLPDTSTEALRQALRRLKRKGRIVQASRGSNHWVIVPLQDSVAGAPPLESWLHDYLGKTLLVPYYLGLLSAAEIYGVSPYAVMVTQIVVSKPRRPIQVGRHKLEFIVRANLSGIPTQWHETVNGRIKVSTADVTALELVQRQSKVGGVDRVIAVLNDLFDCCTASGLADALAAIDDVAAAQRIGALLAIKGLENLTQVVEGWVRGKRSRPVSLYNLEEGAMIYNVQFKVHLPEQLQPANA